MQDDRAKGDGEGAQLSLNTDRVPYSALGMLQAFCHLFSQQPSGLSTRILPYKWGSYGSEKVINLSKATQLARSRARFDAALSHYEACALPGLLGSQGKDSFELDLDLWSDRCLGLIAHGPWCCLDPAAVLDERMKETATILLIVTGKVNAGKPRAGGGTQKQEASPRNTKARRAAFLQSPSSWPSLLLSLLSLQPPSFLFSPSNLSSAAVSSFLAKFPLEKHFLDKLSLTLIRPTQSTPPRDSYIFLEPKSCTHKKSIYNCEGFGGDGLGNLREGMGIDRGK